MIKNCLKVHGKTTDEWHTGDIRVTYGWHMGTYGWHTSPYEWHLDDIRVTNEYIWMTCEWHTNDM